MKPSEIYKGLQRPVSEVNLNFKIKVNSNNETGKNLNILAGVSGLIRLVNDIELVNKLIERAFNSASDKCVCKLRRGIKITFYRF